ncbi:MAG: hypothetical protein KKC39_04275 [Candidatus Omnitrophica bacterium]|nr:hypothetical protein [Candidatus Omnitrophota bacterium]MBU4467938.1 hypothetical protein [Candidatus Omnitrophota bacterium]MCG2708591.1 hypothetical protein [Candidatus Omnitrophota bacterium]
MTNSRDKLNEAKYFLEEMRRTSSDPDKFRYELTALLAASRSITLIMQKEFSGKTGFDDWYIHKQSEIKKNPTLKYLHRQRDISHHEHPVLQHNFDATAQITDSKSTNIILTGTGSSIGILSSPFANYTKIYPGISVKYYFSDFADKEKDVIDLCQEAIDTIESIVNECENKFDNQ